MAEKKRIFPKYPLKIYICLGHGSCSKLKKLGCWKDTSARAILFLNHKNLKGNYKTRAHALKLCWHYASLNGIYIWLPMYASLSRSFYLSVCLSLFLSLSLSLSLSVFIFLSPFSLCLYARVSLSLSLSLSVFPRSLSLSFYHYIYSQLSYHHISTASLLCTASL